MLVCVSSEAQAFAFYCLGIDVIGILMLLMMIKSILMSQYTWAFQPKCLEFIMAFLFLFELTSYVARIFVYEMSFSATFCSHAHIIRSFSEYK